MHIAIRYLLFSYSILSSWTIDIAFGRSPSNTTYSSNFSHVPSEKKKQNYQPFRIFCRCQPFDSDPPSSLPRSTKHFQVYQHLSDSQLPSMILPRTIVFQAVVMKQVDENDSTPFSLAVYVNDYQVQLSIPSATIMTLFLPCLLQTFTSQSFRWSWVVAVAHTTNLLSQSWQTFTFHLSFLPSHRSSLLRSPRLSFTYSSSSVSNPGPPPHWRTVTVRADRSLYPSWPIIIYVLSKHLP